MIYIADHQLISEFESERESISKYLNIGKEVLWLTQQECIENGPSINQTIDIVRKALISHGKKEYEMPAKIGVHPFPDVNFHAMPAYVPHEKAVGLKWVECFPSNPIKYNLPQTTGLLIMNDIMSGLPLSVMDCVWVTSQRTPAVSAISAQHLHPNAETFGMYGCGVQGIEHIKYITKALTKLKTIYINDIREESMNNLISKVKPELDNLGIKIVKENNIERMAKSCELLCSATKVFRNPQSVVKREWISSGQTLLACDLNSFWDPQLSYDADKFIVDSIPDHKLFEENGFYPENLAPIYSETGEVVAGIKQGRTSKDELIVCSNVGMAVTDVVMGREIMMNALKNSKGSLVNL